MSILQAQATCIMRDQWFKRVKYNVYILVSSASAITARLPSSVSLISTSLVSRIGNTLAENIKSVKIN